MTHQLAVVLYKLTVLHRLYNHKMHDLLQIHFAQINFHRWQKAKNLCWYVFVNGPL